MMRHLNIALIQLLVNKNKYDNLRHAIAQVRLAREDRADLDLIALPECFNSPYGVEHFKECAEAIPEGPTSQMLSETALLEKIYIIGGTIPEKVGDKIYNTCTVWNPRGELIAKYRKVHLFDIDIPGKITFKESDVLTAGDRLVTFDIGIWKIGLGICYDIRFGEMAKIYRNAGCHLLIYPAAFNTITGPVHWTHIQQGCAIENQMYVCLVSPARGTEGYIAYGHTQVTDPWGKVFMLEAHEDILFETLDMDDFDEIRQNIPVFQQRRLDLYETVYKKDLYEEDPDITKLKLARQARQVKIDAYKKREQERLDLKNAQLAASKSNTQDAENTSNIQDAGNKGNVQDAGNKGNTQDADIKTNTQDAMDIENVETAQDAMDTEIMRKKEECKQNLEEETDDENLAKPKRMKNEKDADVTKDAEEPKK